ncbi:oxidoreductase CipA [Sporothrix brasiliensis 5110]|uniref:Oxidoreductase CipA n=1 Tax=Sporothrix brasiliensis 5110 TaxID=1398154 RepID=A0A0C2FN91_9PEZI|nr:oxidoreductase CipA [Sporothrix brasiliensis 5110]KIH92493.1 oxidoreductase CipA [Sporothrix brasiliensis 5110]
MAAVQYAKDQPAGFKNKIEKVAIVGAAGYIGSNFTRELLKTGKHTITALTRADSKNAIPDGVQKVVVDYDDHSSIVKALTGQDFLIITLSVRAPRDLSLKLATAAAEAGIRWIMPNAYGPNPNSQTMYDEMGFGQSYRGLMAKLHELKLNPVVLTCGFWYEFSLAGGLNRYGFDIANRKVTLFDKGDVQVYTSTLPQCGRAAAALLSLPVLPEDASSDASATLSHYTEPQPAYIRSFHVSQNDMLASLKRVTGTTDADWTITSEPSKERWANATKALQSGGGFQLDGKTPMSPLEAFGMVMYTRIFFPGGDGLTDKDIKNGALGLPDEDLDEWTKEAVRLVETNELATYGQ